MAFQITLADSDNGHFLDEDGSWSDRPDSHFSRDFESEAEARSAGEETLNRFPFAECWIENLETGDRQHFKHPHRDQYFHEKHEWEAWQKLPTLMRVFARKPDCHIYEPKES